MMSTSHYSKCTFCHGTTEEKFEVERITAVFGKRDRRMFKVQWTDHPGEDSWVHEESLMKDGCKPSIDKFWTISHDIIGLLHHSEHGRVLGASRMLPQVLTLARKHINISPEL